MDVYGESGGSLPSVQPAVTTDRESELRRGVAEARPGDDGHTVQLALALDYGRQGLLVHVGSPLELPEHHAPHALEAGLVDERLQLPVEVDDIDLLVVLEEEDCSLQVRHVRGAEEQAQGTQVPSEQPALRFAFVHDLVSGVGYEVTSLLVLVPEVVAPVVGGQDFEGFPAHEAPFEVLPRVIDAEFHAEGREMRPRVGD